LFAFIPIPCSSWRAGARRTSPYAALAVGSCALMASARVRHTRVHERTYARLLAADVRYPPAASYKIEHDGRTSITGTGSCGGGERGDRAAARISSRVSGLRRSVDLRKTPYSDAYLYYMLPTSSRRPTTSRWTRASRTRTTPQPRGPGIGPSRDPLGDLAGLVGAQRLPQLRSDASTKVLARDFCLVGTYLDLYQLYRKCH